MTQSCFRNAHMLLASNSSRAFAPWTFCKIIFHKVWKGWNKLQGDDNLQNTHTYTQYTQCTIRHTYSYEWMMHLYSALLCIVVHPKRFTTGERAFVFIKHIHLFYVFKWLIVLLEKTLIHRLVLFIALWNCIALWSSTIWSPLKLTMWIQVLQCFHQKP